MRNCIRHRLNTGAHAASIVAISAIALNCMNKPLSPVAPTWQTNMTAPVSVRSYSLADLVAKDTSLFGIVPGGTQLVYRTTVQSNLTFVGNLVSLSPVSCSAQAQIGAIAINGASFALDVPFPPGFPRGTTTPVPPLTFTSSSLQGKLPGLDSVRLQSGTAELHLRNNLPVPVTVQNQITLMDADGTACGSFDFGSSATIQPKTESTASLDLAGKFLTANLSLTGVTLTEPGSAQAVSIPTDSLVVAILVAKNPVVRSAIVTTIPAQAASKCVNASLAIKDSNLVSDLSVKSGSITIHFQSSVPVNVSFSYSVGELFTPSGSAYTDNIPLPANGTFDRTLNLAGYRLHSPGGAFISALDVAGTLALSQISGEGQVKIQETDGVTMTLTSTSIVADNVVGVLKPTWVNINAVLPIKLGDLSKKFKGQVNIPEANLRLIPQSTIQFPLQLDLKLQAESTGGQMLSEMDVPQTRMTGALQPIDFVPGDVGKFLSSISGQLPDSLRVQGAVLINPDYVTTSPQSVGSTSWFGGQIQVSFPLTCSLTSGRFSDTASIGDTSGGGAQGHTLVDQKTASSMNGITLHIVIDNAIPLQVALKFGLLDRGGRLVMLLPQTAGDSITIPAPAVSGGSVQAPAHAERIITLAGTEVQQFNSAYSLAYNLTLATAGTGAVEFDSTQKIRISVWAEFSYQVNK